MSIVTRGLDTYGQLLITRGYGVSLLVRGVREVVRLVSKLNRAIREVSPL